MGQRGRGNGLTINIVNPGAGANTPGMADEMRAMSREGRAPRLVEPEEMVAPLLYIVSREADNVNGWRFDANLWNASLPPAQAACQAGPRLASRCTRSQPEIRAEVTPRGIQLAAGRHSVLFRGAPNTEEWRYTVGRHAIVPASSPRV